MQTLRKRTSPCKYKNDPSRFLGEGITFKAKLIGILEVSEARGDKMCQDALNDLKTAIRAAGEHKQRITISISIDGLRLRDEKTGECLYHHPVHKISFIAQDISDSRAFGYIFGSPDTGHRFFGIKTDKTASQVVISMRDLFQVVFELKKKEIEMAKHHSEHHRIKYGNTGYMDSIHFSKDDSESDKGKEKYSILKSRCLTSKSGDSASSDAKGTTSEAIADLLDLEHELNSIQQGINQMDKITPSDPFGPLSKGESYINSFDDSFSSKVDKAVEDKYSTRKSVKNQSLEEESDFDKHSSFLGSAPSTSKTHFFSQFSPGIGKSKVDDSKWFDQETESLFNETVNVNNAEPTSSPIALNTPVAEPDQNEGKKSPIKTDLFTELDPLGTGSVKPYVDKKHFFQDLKNPPKKVLKEMITDPVIELPSFYFPAHFKDGETCLTIPLSRSECNANQPSNVLDSIHGFKDSSNAASKYMRIDPFDDGDPFEKTDPFEEENFPCAIGFPPLFKTSTDEIFDEKMSWKFDKPAKDEKPGKSSPTNLPLFSSIPLRVSLPPEKTDAASPLSISTITSKLKSSPNSPENSKNVRRKCYQSLKQTTAEGSEESPVHEEPFVSSKINNSGFKPEIERRSPFKDKFYSVQSPSKTDKVTSKTYSSVEMLDATTPDPPPRGKAALFFIKPPPLPPKKQIQPVFKPPARGPSLEDSSSHYDRLDRKEGSCNGSQVKEELRCVKLKKHLFTGKVSPPPSCELRKQNSEPSFPLLPPPPHRKASGDGSKINAGRKIDDKGKPSTENAGSILNIKLNQLDSAGLENLATTLGIPSEQIFSMTLQELTKMLAEKYLTSMEMEAPRNNSFEADFDTNFAKTETNPQNLPVLYDKYAVFKELMESETKEPKNADDNDNDNNVVKQEVESSIKEEKTVKEAKEEEDKYAALRQLSLNAQKSENFSEDLDDEEPKDGGSQETENVSGMRSMDAAGLAPDNGVKWQFLETENENIDAGVDNVTPKEDSAKVSEIEEVKDVQFFSENQLFSLGDQFSDEKKHDIARDNWATFEKSDFDETITKKPAESFNENENSPFSSDGKEEVREIPFHWHQNVFKKKNRKDVPWQDDDESWDEYSPKESFCSDESSQEEQSPDTMRGDRYEKTSWNVCGRPPKSERLWNEKSGQWSHRNKWQEETEDEFEETWRKQRERTGSYDSDRKNNFWHVNSYDGCNKRCEWCNSRSEPWDENERHLHCYTSRRKRSESDNEYRKRCDSDASDKECVWTFQKNYQDGRGRSGKQKQYYGSGHSFRDCPEYCHQSRTKHRKGVSQKRPSSASESKKIYEKIFSPSDYAFRGGDKTGKRETEKNEFSTYSYGCKDARHRTDSEFPHYYSSYDRKMSGHHSKTGRSRGSNSNQSEMYPSPNKREAMEGYFEPFSEKDYKFGKPESVRHFEFDSEAKNYQKKSTSNQSPKEFIKSPDRRTSQWASTNGKTEGDAFSARNNNESFANFKEELKNSPKKGKESGKPKVLSHVDFGKSQGKPKNHLTLMARQESSSTLRKSDSINIFSRDKDPFEGDDFFSSVS